MDLQISVRDSNLSDYHLQIKVLDKMMLLRYVLQKSNETAVRDMTMSYPSFNKNVYLTGSPMQTLHLIVFVVVIIIVYVYTSIVLWV